MKKTNVEDASEPRDAKSERETPMTAKERREPLPRSEDETEDLPDRMEAEPVAQIVHRGREMGF